MTDRIAPIVLELAAEVRGGGDLEALIPEFAADYEIREDVLRARFARAYPNGVGAAMPSEAEMLERRRVEIDKIHAENEAMARSILEFFAERPALKMEVRRNIYRFTGKQSCNLATAKAIADRLTK